MAFMSVHASQAAALWQGRFAVPSIKIELLTFCD
jgi:hypothetical protein